VEVPVITLIKAAGGLRPLPNLPTWDELRALVANGDLVERVHVIYDQEPAWLMIDERGLLKNLPLNAIATEVYRENWKRQGRNVSSLWIVGDAVLISGSDYRDYEARDQELEMEDLKRRTQK